MLCGAVAKKRFNDHPFAYHEEIELEITTLTNLGSGLGRVTLPESQISNLKSQITTQPPAPASGWAA